MATRLWTPEMLADAATRNAAGESICRIARSYGRERSALYRMLKRQGIAIRNDGSWSRTLTLTTDPTELGYIAGLTDGEGSIFWSEGTGIWQVKIAMTDRPVIEWLATFGGVFDIQPKGPGRKTAYCWRVSRRLDVVTLLRAILPLLKVPGKRANAEKALTDYKDYACRHGSAPFV